jgi:hypothetical protein
LADILSEPSLSMPITVGLYAKWGSGKSFLLNKLRGMYVQQACSVYDTVIKKEFNTSRHYFCYLDSQFLYCPTCFSP